MSACDFSAGVSRVYRLEEVPLPVCIEGTLGRVARVTDLRYAPGEVNARALHRYSYRAEGVEVRLDIEQKPLRPRYLHSYLVINTVPPDDLVARLRPVMARVDQALENNCGLRGLKDGAREYCFRGPFRPTSCIP